MMNDKPGLDSLQQLLQIMDRLREPGQGCPWDLQQTFATIAPHTLEEVYEVVDAIESGDMAQLRDELGDLLFQIVFYARLGKERQLFDFDAIAAGISHKLLRRHPHVFTEGRLERDPPGITAGAEISAGQVAVNWETLKQAERERKFAGRHPSVLDDVPLALPALLRAAKLQKRAATQGFDWTEIADVLAKVREETGELEAALATAVPQQIEEELGDLLFTLVNLSRHLELNPETSLRKANGKFEQRFRAMETLLRNDGLRMQDLDEKQLDEYWERVKSLGKKAADE